MVASALQFLVTRTNKLPFFFQPLGWLSPTDTHGDRGALSHLQVVRCDDGNVTRLDASIQQSLDVQTDEEHLTWKETKSESPGKGIV